MMKDDVYLQAFTTGFVLILMILDFILVAVLVFVDAVSSSSINVTILEEPDAVSYELVITDPEGNETLVAITPEMFMNGSFPYTIENLDPGTDYEISVRYTNLAGETVDGTPVMARTPGII